MLELRLRRMIEDASTSESSLRRLFSRFDKDNSGKLSRQEMKRVFNELGVKSSDAEIQELIFGLDKSNDGLCSYEEFIRIAFPSSNVDSAAGSSGIGSTSSLVTLLTERLKEMIRLASGSERELRALFSKFDTQNTGRITRNKFQRAFANMGLSAPAKEVQQLIDSMDTNGDGMVSYGEFVSVVHNNSSSGSRNRNIPSRVHEVLQRLVNDNSWTRTSLRRLFLSFDKDNSGYITRSEFRRVFNENLKIRASDSEIDELIRTIDTNRDGRISYAEFIDIAYQGRNSTSAIAADNRRGGSSRKNDRDDYYDDDRRGGRNNNSSLRRTPRNEFFGRGQSDLVEKFKSAMRRANWTRASLNDLFNKFDGNESCFFCYWCFFFLDTYLFYFSVLVFFSLKDNKNGSISYSEFSNVVRRDLNLGETYISRSDVDRLLDNMDKNRDGNIDYYEFCDFILGKNADNYSTMNSTNGSGDGRLVNDHCLRYVDNDLKRQLQTDMPWGDKNDLLDMFEIYDKRRLNQINQNDFINVIGSKCEVFFITGLLWLFQINFIFLLFLTFTVYYI